MTKAGLALVAGLALCGCGAAITPMPGRAGDATPLTGLGQGVRPVPMRPAWRLPLNEGPIYRVRPQELATPAYDPVGNRLAVGSANGWFHLIRATDGHVLWRIRLPGGVSSEPAFDGARVLAGTDDGDLLALDIGSGRELWRYAVQGAVMQAPVIGDELVYFVDGTNSVYAVSRTDGAWRWQYRRDPPAEFSVVGEGRPLVAGGRLYVGFSDGYVAALDAADGAVLWTRDLAPEHERFQDVDGTPVLLGGTLFAASSASGLHALDPETGSVRWVAPISGVTRMAAHDGDLVLSSDRGTLVRVEATTGRTLWQTRFQGGAPGRAVVAAERVVVGLSKGALHFVEALSGRPIQHFLPDLGFSADVAAGADGAVFILSNGGVLYAFLPRT